MKITDLKSKYSTIAKRDGRYWVSWNYNDVEDNYGSWDTLVFDNLPNSSIIVSTIKQNIDTDTKYAIENYFQWKGYSVKLSSTNQANYKANYDLAYSTNGEALPITVKFTQGNEDVYYTFTSLDDIKDFYTSMVKFINTTLEKGWKLKDTILESQYTL